MRYALYNPDDDSFIGGTYRSPKAVEEDLVGPLNNCMIVAVDLDWEDDEDEPEVEYEDEED